jgi:hypothetical protein
LPQDALDQTLRCFVLSPAKATATSIDSARL